MDLQLNSTQVQRGAGTISSETIPNYSKKEGLPPNLFYEVAIIPIQNLGENQQRKKTLGQYL